MKSTTSRKTNEDNLKFISGLFSEIEHFVFFGTLLGLVRGGRLIESDDDIDIYVNIKHRSDLLTLLLDNGFSVDFAKSSDSTKLFVQITTFFVQASREVDGEAGSIDIYFFEDDEDTDYILDRWNFRGDVLNEKSFIKFKNDDIFPIATFELDGVGISIPKNSEKVVELIYGKEWKKPLQKGKEYRMVIVNNTPWIFIGKIGMIRRKIVRILGELHFFRVG